MVDFLSLEEALTLQMSYCFPENHQHLPFLLGEDDFHSILLLVSDCQGQYKQQLACRCRKTSEPCAKLKEFVLPASPWPRSG
jgi:hypothetical protein